MSNRLHLTQATTSFRCVSPHRNNIQTRTRSLLRVVGVVVKHSGITNRATIQSCSAWNASPSHWRTSNRRPGQHEFAHHLVGHIVSAANLVTAFAAPSDQ